MKKYLYILSLIGIIAYGLLPISSAQAALVFNRVVVDSQGPGNMWLKTVGDINGDGQTDLVAGGNASGGLVWYQSPSWTKHTIASGSGFSTDGEVVDVDRDGDQDLIVLTSSDLRWYENPSWTVHVIENRVLHDVEVSDLDGDGDVDLAARNQGDAGNQLHLYRQDSPTSWTHRSVNCSIGEGLKAVDVDRDGDQDVAIGGAWFENSGDVVNGVWSQYTYSSSWTELDTFVSAGDMNKDGRVDILLSPSESAGGTYRISWFEAPANPKNANWLERIVENNVETVHHFVGVADMDNDGDLDIASAEMEQGSDPDDVKVYLNQDGVGGAWVKQVIATSGSHSMRIVDVGNDGDYDLYGANWQGSNQVELWVNQTNPTGGATNTPLPTNTATQTPSPTAINTSTVASTPTNTPGTGGISLTSWGRQVIDADKGDQTVFVLPGDLDGDGDQDVVSGGVWYRNPGSLSGTWNKVTIGSPLNQMALVYDLDGDGDLDILGTQGVGSAANSNFAWGQNNGSGGFTIRTNIPAGDGDFLQGVAVGNFGGGNLEVALSWHGADRGIQVLTVPGNPASTQWGYRKLNNSSGQPVTSQDEALSAGDIDRDGDTDLLTGTMWLQSNGSSWTERTLFSPTGAPDRNKLADINKDGRLDAIVGYEAISVSGKLAWYEQPTTATNTWTERLIANVTGPMSVDVADMDGDGDLDVVVGEHNLDNPSSARLLVFENTNGVGGTWTQRVVYTGDEHHDGAQTADFDGDGDLDIVSIGWQNPRVQIYDNKAGGGSPNPTSTPMVNTNTPTSTSTGMPATLTPVYTPTSTPSVPTATATATSAASPSPTPGSSSVDNFDSSTLGAGWTFVDPLGNSSYSLSNNPGHLQLSIPAGSEHDCWNSTNNCARMIRSVGSGNATYEVKLDGNALTSNYQAYGILLSQNNTNYLRFEYWRGGGSLSVKAWKIINGSGSQVIGGPTVTLTGADYLRVTKTNNTYLFAYKLGNGAWQTAGSFTQSGFTPNQAGIEIINAGTNLASAVQVDYFSMTGSTPTSTPVPANTATGTPTYTPASTPTRTNTPLAANTATQTPTLTRTVTPTSTSTVTAATSTAVSSPTPGAGYLENFSSSTLGAGWTFVDPLGNSSYSLSNNPGHLQLSIPAGSEHDCWNSTNNCARMIRSVGSGNATYEVKLDGNALTSNYQAYGILLSQNNTNYLRFEYWRGGGSLSVKAWKIINGSGSQVIGGPTVTLTGADYLRVTKTNNTYLFAYKLGNGAWQTAGSFTQSGFTPNQAGIEIINAGTNLASIAQVDYFSVTGSTPTSTPMPASILNAALETSSPTYTPSLTNTPTNAPAVTNTPLPTDTLTQTPEPTATDTPAVTATGTSTSIIPPTETFTSTPTSSSPTTSVADDFNIRE